jgi:FlaA1/EpsC-like NDP-sugar epimerase
VGSRDIRIAFTGSRPGEKIHEELYTDDDAVGETSHPKIMRLSRPPVDPEWLAGQLAELERLADEGDTLEVVGKLRTVVTKPQRLQPPNLSDTGSYVIDIEPRVEVDSAD